MSKKPKPKPDQDQDDDEHDGCDLDFTKEPTEDTALPAAQGGVAEE